MLFRSTYQCAEILLLYAAAIITHFHQLSTVILHSDIYERSTCIQRVFNQFFHGGGEVENDLTGADAMDALLLHTSIEAVQRKDTRVSNIHLMHSAVRCCVAVVFT